MVPNFSRSPIPRLGRVWLGPLLGAELAGREDGLESLLDIDVELKGDMEFETYLIWKFPVMGKDRGRRLELCFDLGIATDPSVTRFLKVLCCAFVTQVPFQGSSIEIALPLGQTPRGRLTNS